MDIFMFGGYGRLRGLEAHAAELRGRPMGSQLVRVKPASRPGWDHADGPEAAPSADPG